MDEWIKGAIWALATVAQTLIIVWVIRSGRKGR